MGILYKVDANLWKKCKNKLVAVSYTKKNECIIIKQVTSEDLTQIGITCTIKVIGKEGNNYEKNTAKIK